MPSAQTVAFGEGKRNQSAFCHCGGPLGTFLKTFWPTVWSRYRAVQGLHTFVVSAIKSEHWSKLFELATRIYRYFEAVTCVFVEDLAFAIHRLHQWDCRMHVKCKHNVIRINTLRCWLHNYMQQDNVRPRCSA